LARLYGVETRALHQAMKRNQERFPCDFMFDLARQEIRRISQTVTSLRRLRFSRDTGREHPSQAGPEGSLLAS
jgi:hypothetical protein